MIRILAALALATSLALIPAHLMAQGAQSNTASAQRASTPPKVGKDEKVCRYRFPSGEVKTWVCKKEQPCCAWDLFSYVKCGSTITGCL
jgi:hypothetical protein